MLLSAANYITFPLVRALIQELAGIPPPEEVVAALPPGAGAVLLRTALFDSPSARYSLITSQPMLTLQAYGARCELDLGGHRQAVYGNPWEILRHWLQRFELPDEPDCPFPLGGAFGYWGYDLKHFVEPRLPRQATNDLELPDCHVGFYDSVLVLDHRLEKTFVVATGLLPDGSRSRLRAAEQIDFWRQRVEEVSSPHPELRGSRGNETHFSPQSQRPLTPAPSPAGGEGAHRLTSSMSREAFLAAVRVAQRYIQAGDIYQVNLSHRLEVPSPCSPWALFERLLAVSPAPYAAWLDGGDFQIASSSPEQFLRFSGAHVQTRPIKGTRPRGEDATRDAQLMYELQTSPKELAELLMITDLLRNDLGRVCEYGSIHVPELARIERFPQVQHLVSTVEGRLRPELTHLDALAACFPGGSITGAPKIRAMEIIDELEPIARGPYTGCIGYLGFNRESQLNIAIRTAVCTGGRAYFHVGAGIVADSVPEAEYDETLAKAAGFLAALNLVPANTAAPTPPLLTPGT